MYTHTQDYGNGGGLIGTSSGNTATSSATNPSSSSTSSSSSGGGGVGGGSGLGSLMPILGAAGLSSSAVASAVAVIDAGVHDSVMEGLGSQELDFTSTAATVAGGLEDNDGQPPAKKMYVTKL